jgi:hypothetical protein
MTKDNVTGKNKDFYDLGKKMFDRLNPKGAINPEIVGFLEPQREWVGLTDEDMNKLWHLVDWTVPLDIKKFARAIEAKLKEKNT